MRNVKRWALLGALFCALGSVAARGQMTPISPDGSLFPDSGPHRPGVSPYAAAQARALREGMAAAAADASTRTMMDDAARTPQPKFVRQNASAAAGVGEVLALRPVPSGTVVHFTVDGTRPTLASPVYVHPLPLHAHMRVRAIAVRPGGTPSDETSLWTSRLRR